MKLKKFLLACSLLSASFSQAVTLPISGGGESGIMLSKDGKVYAWGGEELNNLGSNNPKSCRKHLALDTTVEGFEKKAFYTTPQLVDTKGIKFIQVDAGSGSLFTGISDKGILYYWGLTKFREPIAKRDTIVSKIISATDSITKLDTIIKIQYVVPDSIINRPMPVKCAEEMAGYNEDGSSNGQYLGRVKKVKCSNSGFIAIMEDSTAIMSHDFNELAYVQTPNGEIIKNIVDINARDFNYYAVTKDGTLYTQEDHSNYDDDPTFNFFPVLEEKTKEPLKNVVSVGAGDKCRFAITKDGNAYGWGEGGWGGCTGIGKLMETKNAMPIVSGQYSALNNRDFLTNIKQIEGGMGYGMAVTFDGYVLYWGNNEGVGGVAPSNDKGTCFIKPIFAIYEDGRIVDDAVAIECGDNFGFVINKKNEIFAFGRNDLGQCGVGEDSITEIHYLHPMNFSNELTICPSVRLLGDTTIACTNGGSAIEALTSSVSDDKDYRLDWYFNGKKLAEKSNICVVDEEGEYKVVITPTDSLCETSSDYIYAKANKDIIESIDNQILVGDSASIKNQNVTFKLTSAEATTIVLYRDEECTNAIDTLTIEVGENIINVPGSSLSLKGDTANVWVKESKQTTLFPEINGSNSSSFQNYGMLLKTENTATLHSFKFKANSYVGSTDITATPMLYRADMGNLESIRNYQVVSKGHEQKFVVNREGTECTVVCDFKIHNNGIYVIGMEFKGSVNMFVASTPDFESLSSVFFEEPITDENNYGIEWVGSSANSYTSANGYNKTCYYDLIFSDIEFVSCGAVKLTTNLESEKSDCINVTKAKDTDGENYDILGRKVINVQPKKIYIQNGKKYIINNK